MELFYIQFNLHLFKQQHKDTDVENLDMLYVHFKELPLTIQYSQYLEYQNFFDK